MGEPRMHPDDARRMREALLRDGTWEAIGHRRRRTRAVVLAAAVALVLASAGGLAGVAAWLPRVSLHAAQQAPGEFESLAGRTHAALASGREALVYESGDRAKVIEWVRTRTGVGVSLADRHGRSDGDVFRLRGASLAEMRGVRAAVVLYVVDGHPVTLLSAPEDQVADSPKWTLLGKQVRVRALEGGASLLSWSSSGQAYALVSPLPGAGQRACLICHADRRRVQVITGLTLQP